MFLVLYNLLRRRFAGNLVFLMRGADAHQRHLYPLELQTNRRFLPGADAARIMFDHYEEAAEFAVGAAVAAFPHERNVSDLSTMLRVELSKYHRVLQYAVAAGLAATPFLRHEVMIYTGEYYDETKMPYDMLIAGVEHLGHYYKNRMESTKLASGVVPCIKQIVDQLSKSRLRNSLSGGDQPVAQAPWEAPPDPKSITPLLLDKQAFDVVLAAATTDEDRRSINIVQKKLTQAK
eukprot:GHVT01080172.1.p1 GENE.GHVT01080172.1~~GHVT01080172.1.p1  ORF type:complete len:234 (-),score=20.35 GHVT01080172.1:18-719(-)